MTNVATVVLSPTVLRAMAAFASTDEKRPVITGVHVALRPLSLQLAATDSYCAGIYREAHGDERYVKEIVCREPTEFIVPVAAIMPLLKLKLAEAKIPIPLSIAYDGNEILFERGPWSVRLPAIEGKFPDISQLFEGQDPHALDEPVLGLGMPFGAFIEFAGILATASNTHMTFYGSNKVIGVRYPDSDALRDSFMGAIMPVGTDQEHSVVGPPEWMQLQLVDA